jgi:two-component system chemotaxis response regulator CheB
VITHPRARLGLLGHTRDPLASAPPSPAVTGARGSGRYELVAIGASTGGPGAILELLRSLRQPFPLPILFVLHIGEPFARAFADWLDGQTEMRVGYARDGDRLAAGIGRVVMAPPDVHLALDGDRLRLTRDAMRHSCRPSVDALFESVARSVGPAAIAVLLTGMGRDGAAGLLDVRRAGGHTIAQDEASSVVYGMPREAVLLGAVDRQLPLHEIGPSLSDLAGCRVERRAP